jgi:Asp-tRNA(Asn)/Glu-tRNA(Gln) amidotransferase A subunit family amidase
MRWRRICSCPVGARPSLADDLGTASASDISEAIRRRRVSAVEVVERCLQRIEAANPRLNAIATLVEEHARTAAERADRASARRRELPLLHGVPFTVKDSIATGGIRTTAGSLLLADFVPRRDAPAVERLRRAGAILIGKTNCPEFALDLHTDNRLFGRTLNPRNEEVTPGGSSGGDSAAVAAGLVPFGLGSDYGGSVRWPAHCTGIVGLRPTVGLVPATGQLPYPRRQELPAPNSVSLQGQVQVIGPLARAVDDLWLTVKVMAGPDGRDMQTVPVALGDPAKIRLSDLGCASFESEGAHPIREDVACVVEEAATCLAGLGMRTICKRPPGLEKAEGIFAALRAADGLPDHEALAAGREDELTDSIRNWFSVVRRSVTVAEYRELAAKRGALRARVLSFMERWPILLLPVASIPAFKVGTERFVVEGVEVPRFQTVSCCRAISLLGLPAAVVPCGSSREGLPVGVQIVGRPFADHEVVAVAAVLEQSFGPWQPPQAAR